MKPTARDRTKDRDVMALSFLNGAGPSSTAAVAAHLHSEGSFAGSRCRGSRESGTRQSLGRLMAAGKVERDVSRKPYLYAAKGAS